MTAIHAVTMPTPNRLHPLDRALEIERARALLPSPSDRRRIRVAAGVPISVVAITLGVSHATVARWELGTRSPRADLLEPYAEILTRLSACTEHRHADA